MENGPKGIQPEEIIPKICTVPRRTGEGIRGRAGDIIIRTTELPDGSKKVDCTHLEDNGLCKDPIRRIRNLRCQELAF